MPGRRRERDRITALELDVAVRDTKIAEAEEREQILRELVEDLAKPVLARKGDGPAGTSVIGGRSPRTRWSVAITAILIVVALLTIFVIVPLTQRETNRPADASTAKARGFSLVQVCRPLRNLTTQMDRKFHLGVTSTTGGVHAPGSYHYSGRATDNAGAYSNMYAASLWLIRTGRYRRLAEGIHNPGLSVSNGRLTNGAATWGNTTWRQHADHIHLAMKC